MARDTATGKGELRAALSGAGLALAAAVLFSAFVNLLLLTSPLYMLQVYDRALAARSEPTLVALSLIVALLFLILGVLDHARSRILAGVGTRLQARLDRRVLLAALDRLARNPAHNLARTARRDLDALVRPCSTPAAAALIDLPWTPLFLMLLFVFHPALGSLGLVSVILLALVTTLNQLFTAAAAEEVSLAAMAADRLIEPLADEAELIGALGMADAVFDRWRAARLRSLDLGLGLADLAGAFAVASRTLRLALQSAILGLGAWLVLRDQLSGGAMVAASVVLGRALQPVESVIAHWPVLAQARAGHSRLAGLLAEAGAPARPMPLPRPEGRLEVTTLSLMPPGGTRPVLRGVSFTLPPGQAMAVIGPSGSGKSSLARALTGAWTPAAGRIRLGGVPLDQLSPGERGRLIGYLPQRVTLFEGTIAENIARLDPCADPDRVIAAAQAASAHQMILDMPRGYDTPVGPSGSGLAGGQVQRIGLARALYGRPVLLVLDEPNASLDAEGQQALNRALRAARAGGTAVLVMAHRPAALQECDLLLVLREGRMQACGPRDTLLGEVLRNPAEVARNLVPGGAVAGDTA